MLRLENPPSLGGGVCQKDDTPAFFSEEFFNNVKKGQIDIPTRKGSYHVSLKPEDVYCFIFWTKNCSDHFIQNMKSLKSPFYIQWTITGYDKDIEPQVPDKTTVMDRFKTVSNLIGPNNVIWRYDPILISNKYTAEFHQKRFAEMAEYLKGYTNHCVISFLDEYGKIQNEIRNRTMRKPTMPEINAMAKSFAETAAKTGLRIQTCAERGYDLTKYGIHEGPCVDADYIETLIGEKLPSYIRKTDSFRRCDCAVNTDIGTYHRCQHDCKYCYAK